MHIILFADLQDSDIPAVKLTEDVVFAEGDPMLLVPAGRDVTLDLNGHTVDAAPMSDPEKRWNDDVLAVEGGLTMKDSLGNGALTGIGNGALVYIGDENACFVLESGKVSGTDTIDGAVIVSQGGFRMKGGVIQGKRAYYGLWTLNGASALLEGGEIIGDECDYTSIVTGDVTLDGCIITDRDGNNAGLFVEGQFTVNSGEIFSESSADYYVGIIVQDGGECVMNGGTITGKNLDYGTIMVSRKSGFTMNGGTVLADGGYCALHLVENDSCEVNGGRIQGEDSDWRIALNGCIAIGGDPEIIGTVVMPVQKTISVKGELGENVLISVWTTKKPAANAIVKVTEGLPGNGTDKHFICASSNYRIGLTGDGEAAIFSLEFGEADFVLPAGTLKIEQNAFEGADMASVLVTDGCEAIGAEAFKNCRRLTHIRVPGACEIGGNAFDGCGTVILFSEAGSTAEASSRTCDNVVFVELAP